MESMNELQLRLEARESELDRLTNENAKMSLNNKNLTLQVVDNETKVSEYEGTLIAYWRDIANI